MYLIDVTVIKIMGTKFRYFCIFRVLFLFFLNTYFLLVGTKFCGYYQIAMKR